MINIEEHIDFPFVIFHLSLVQEFSARRLDGVLVPRRARRTSPLSKRCALVVTPFVVGSNGLIQAMENEK
jgi:hypothetical protein